MKRIAVILFNLGGPDNLDAVRPFLLNLFSDPAILRAPAPFRQIVARLIAARRAKKAMEIYAKIGGGSPILANTQAQTAALSAALAGDGAVKCFVAMRYWHPFADETARLVKEFAPDEIVLLPLYPQSSTTTTASSIKSWHDAAKGAGITAPAKTICCYPEEPGFIRALARPARAAYEKAKAYGNPRFLFSAHGLPQKIIAAGDPYRFQCERTAATLAKEIGIADSDWALCYQSRVGPMKWIGPSTEEEIARAARDRRPVIIVPVGFVSEHSETLFEIDIFYRTLAAAKGVPYFDRVATAGTAPDFIESLAQLVRKSLNGSGCISGKGGRLCPPGFSGCGMATQKEGSAGA